jgi:Flp pilus assembly protein TadD
MFRPGPPIVWLFLLLGGCTGEAAPTWADGVAAVVHRSCTPCHRLGEAAPFPLVGYADLQKRRELVAEMVATRQMPPWLPTHGEFVGDRRLTAAEIDLLQRWVAAGAPRGEAAREPAPPVFTTGWQLGEPDLVVTADEALVVEASGDDVFRNLVLPVPLEAPRFVAAVEIRPGSRAVHHAVLAVDGTRQARRLDALDAAPGFPGMAMGGAEPPDGQFLGWTPGKRVLPQPRGMAFRLWPGQDFVLQLHVQPTGRTETIQPQIGLYFTDEAPTVTALPLVLWSDRIDIAAGDADFRIRDELQLPVPVVVHAIYPHAHHLGRTLRGTALLPNGTERRLLEIARWDFDWQDDYRLREPLHLPAGTRLVMEYSYDNSAANPNNPNRPPQRVGFGQRSRDEMGTMTFSLTVADAEAKHWLQRAVLQHDLGKAPEAGNLWLQLAGLERERGELGAAFAALQEAERWHPDRGVVLAELGLYHERAGRLDEAERQYRLAVEQDPMQGLAHAQLGALLGRRGDSRAAREHFRIALLTMPNVAALHANLATASVGEGDTATAERHFAQALRLDPEHFAANFLLGQLLLDRGDKAGALPLLRTAARLRPADPAVQRALTAAAR